MTTNATVDVNALFSVKLAPIFQTNNAEMKKLKDQLQTYGTNPVRSWTKLFGECILAITNNRDAVERINKYKPEFIGEIQIKHPNIDFLNNITKNEFVVLFAETLSTILQTEPPVEEQKESVPIVEETPEEKEARERFISNQEAGRDMENGLSQVSYRNDFGSGSGSGSGGSQHKKTPRRRKYSKRNNTRRKRTVRKRRSYK
jgi:hypothetical protein